jgi:L-lysine exporter family protein LysE/ArgO
MSDLTINPSIIALMQGFLLCASTIISFGPQNIFILRQGLRRQHVFTTAFFSTIAEIILITLAVGGLSAIISTNGYFRIGITLVGAAFLIYLGGNALLRAARNRAVEPTPVMQHEDSAGIRTTVIATLGFAFLNPGAYVDTMMIIGSTSLNFFANERLTFAIGAALASSTWFFVLSYGASKLTMLFQSRFAWRILDLVSGVAMLGIAKTLVTALAPLLQSLGFIPALPAVLS